ncbi:MAG: hypothetical protein ACJ72G_06420 [Friedmanniella sp.]
MDSNVGAAALRWWASWAQARATGTRAVGRRPDPEHLELPHDPAALEPAHPQGPRLAGAPEALTRLATVQPDTVAVVLVAGRPPVVRWPGELLVPPLLTRSRGTVRALALSTARVHLDLTVPGLVTLDRYTLEVVRLRLELQLDAGDRYAAVADLAAEQGANLDAALLERVRREATAGVQGAVTMNRRADLQRLTLRRVLDERWLPSSFAGGTLLRRGLEVADLGAASPEDEPTVVLPAAGGGGPPDPGTEDAAPMATAT